jgi:hypothetical protein
MLSVRGIFKDGMAQPMEDIEGRDNQPVIIMFLEDEEIKSREARFRYAESDGEDDWDNLIQLVEDCAVSTGIEDLAHQHNHYLYGTPKKIENPNEIGDE